MKNTFKSLIVMLICFTAIIACKKKKDETPAPVNPTPQAPVKSKIYAKVNGVEWNLGKSGMSDLTYLGWTSTTIGYGGYTSLNTPYSELGINISYTTGVVSLTKYGPFGGHYKHTDGNYYPAISGTLNIGQLDTTNHLSALKATFSFVTDTVAGKSFTITEGEINY